MALLGKVRLSISTVSIILLRFATNIKTTLKIEFQRIVLPHWTKQNYRKLIKISRGINILSSMCREHNSLKHIFIQLKNHQT